MQALTTLCKPQCREPCNNGCQDDHLIQVTVNIGSTLISAW